MAQKDIQLVSPGRIVIGTNAANVPYQEPIPVYNVRSLDNFRQATMTSGTFLIASLPDGIDIFNRELGMVADVSLSGSAVVSGYHAMTGIVLRRPNISISGATVVGRR